MLEEGYHIAGADRRELGFAVAEPMVEEPVGKAPGMIDRAGTDPALPNQILFIIDAQGRSEEHTSELQSLMRISYAVFCLQKKNNTYTKQKSTTNIHLDSATDDTKQ